MRLATIRTGDGTTAARLDGDVLVPLEAADVGELLAAGGEGRPRAGAVPVPAAAADFAPVRVSANLANSVGYSGSSRPVSRMCAR